jgi:hypothetical protein
MQKVDFYKLERSRQDRFIEAVLGIGVPTPILARPDRTATHWFWAAGAVLVLGAWVAVTLTGFGSLEHPWALAPVWMLGVHGLLGCFFALSVLRAMSTRWERRAMPFRPGVYAFPGCIIDATRSTLRVWPFEELSEVRPEVGRIRLALANGTRFSFSGVDAARSEAVLAQLDEARRRFAAAGGDPDALSALDPTRPSLIPNPLAPIERIEPRRFIHPAVAALICLATAAGLSWAVWSARNVMSARQLYRAATERNDTAAYRAYLERGGERADVREVLLPRAELRDAMQQGSVEAIEQYIAKHPDSKIESEVTGVHRAAMLKALEQAKKAGTVTALEELRKRHSGYELVESEWSAAKQAVYDRAFKSFQKTVPPEAEELLAFVDKLLTYASDHGPRVEVRFQQVPVKYRDRIDEMLRKNPYFTDPSQAPNQYFDGAHIEPHEKAAGRRIVEAFQKRFPKDVVSFELGPRVGDEHDAPPKVLAPTLFVEHKTQLSGGYLSSRPRGVFVGAAFLFEVEFVLPKGDAKVAFKYSFWRPPDLKLFQEKGRRPPEIYRAMNADGFERFTSRLLREWLGVSDK